MAAIASPPFSASQIRDATSVGRTYRYRVEQHGKPPAIRTMCFSRVGEADCTITITMAAEDGSRLTEPTSSDSTWDDLVGHASYPADTTTVEDASVTTPAGEFDCLLYRSTDPTSGHMSQAFFARALPGAPVSLRICSGDQLVISMLLLEHVAGSGEPKSPSGRARGSLR